MTTRRRWPIMALLSGVLAVAALAGCRSAPQVAAYVGDGTITEHEVDVVLDEARTAADRANSGKPVDDPQRVRVPLRHEVVATLVVNEICARMAADQQLTLLSVDRAAVARGERLPVDSAFTVARADLYACIATLSQRATPVAPTEAELREIFERGQAAGVINPSLAFEDVGQQLDGQQVRSALGVRKPLQEAVERYGVTVNPRYQPLEIPVLSFADGKPAVVVVLTPGQRDSAVINRA